MRFFKYLLIVWTVFVVVGTIGSQSWSGNAGDLTATVVFNFGILIALPWIAYWVLAKISSNVGRQTDEFAVALAKYKEFADVVNSESSQPVEILDSAFAAIESCQSVIISQENNGDTYLLLANSYLGLASRFWMNGIHGMGFQLASAVMMYWQDNRQMHTRNKSQAKELQNMIAGGYQSYLDRDTLPSHRTTLKMEAIFNGDYLTSFWEATSPENLHNIRNEAMAWIDLEIALSHLESERYDLALVECDSAIGRSPDVADGYLLRAEVNATTGNYSDVIVDLDIYESLAPPNPVSTATRLQAEQGLEQQAAEAAATSALIDKFEEALLAPFKRHEESQQKNEEEKRRLRQVYETRFDDWDEFEKRVTSRLHATMSEQDIDQKVVEYEASDPQSLDALYYTAASNILFTMASLPEIGEDLEAHDYWLNALLQREYDQLLSKKDAESPSDQDADQTPAENHQAGDVFEAIEQIAKLHKEGILTDEEFQTKKTELLGRL